MTINEEYSSIVKARYKKIGSANYEMRGYYDTVLLAPKQYGTESVMLEFAKEHKEATIKEMYDYFNKITPDGLAPGDDGADLMEDD